MKWPEPEGKKRIPGGHYSFRLNKEPELQMFPYTDKDGNPKEGRKILLFAVGLNVAGEYFHAEAIPVWDERYADLCAALGVDHGRDIQMTGSIFEAQIVYAPDKKDPTKSWPRLMNITASNDVPLGQDPEGDDIPF